MENNKHRKMSSCGDFEPTLSVEQAVKNNVKEFYGKTIQKTNDLEIDLCALNKKKMPCFVKQALSEIHSEVTSK